jgi:hypothetical protein
VALHWRTVTARGSPRPSHRRVRGGAHGEELDAWRRDDGAV